MSRWDNEGLFWNEPSKAKGNNAVARALPATPDTGWHMPEGADAFPSLEGQGCIAIDVEAKDLQLREKGPGYPRGDAYVCGVAVATEAGFVQYYPVAHETGPNQRKEHVFKWLATQLARPNQPKVGARLIYDLEALHYEGVTNIAGPFYDVQVAEPLLDETRLSYSLDVLAQLHLGEGKRQSVMLDWLRKAFGDDENNIKKFIYRAPPAVVGPYAEGDVELPLRIFKLQERELKAQGLWELFQLESRLIPVLLAMRLRGVSIDVAHAERLLKELDKEYEAHRNEVKRLCGVLPDVWASDSISKVFDSVGVEYPRTPKGKPSFRKDWLAHQDHPVAKLINDARHMDKMRGTFVQGYLLDGHVNGVVYGQFHQLKSTEGGTVSGRFSSSLPNLQNIPTRTAAGKLIRQAFIGRAGRKWWKLDWSQLEYRLIAHYAAATKQPGINPIIEAYNTDPNTDYHQAVADLTGQSRGDAKNLNFGLAYGMAIAKLCATLGVDREEGERIMNTYHGKAPFMRALMDECGRRANLNGFIRTIGGRRRRFNVWERKNGRGNEPEYAYESNIGQFRHLVDDAGLRRLGWSPSEIDDWSLRTSSNPRFVSAINAFGWRRAFLHKALNALTQGSNADIMKMAMVKTFEDGVYDVLGAPALTVHDELDGDIDVGMSAEVEAFEHIRHVMETVVKLRVPLRADGGFGDNWGAIK